MKEIMELSAFLLMIPFCMGESVLLLLYGDFWNRKRTLREGYLIGGIVCIGLAEITHLISGYFGWSFSDCAKTMWHVWLASTIVMLLCGGISLLLRSLFGKTMKKMVSSEKEIFTSADFIVSVLLCLMLILLAGKMFFFSDYSFYSDATIETTVSFLQTDSMFSVNPFTGFVNEAELPSRFRLLCLPTIYATLSKVCHMEPYTLLLSVLPKGVLVCSLLAFSLVGRSLWPEKRFKRICFLIVICVLLFVTDTWIGQPGYMMFHQGYTAGAIRVLILLPLTLYFLLEKRFASALLPIACEGCICWTFFGTGWCFALMLVWMIVWGAGKLTGRNGGDL